MLTNQPTRWGTIFFISVILTGAVFYAIHSYSLYSSETSQQKRAQEVAAAEGAIPVPIGEKIRRTIMAVPALFTAPVLVKDWPSSLHYFNAETSTLYSQLYGGVTPWWQLSLLAVPSLFFILIRKQWLRYKSGSSDKKLRSICIVFRLTGIGFYAFSFGLPAIYSEAVWRDGREGEVLHGWEVLASCMHVPFDPFLILLVLPPTCFYLLAMLTNMVFLIYFVGLVNGIFGTKIVKWHWLALLGILSSILAFILSPSAVPMVGYYVWVLGIGMIMFPIPNS